MQIASTLPLAWVQEAAGVPHFNTRLTAILFLAGFFGSVVGWLVATVLGLARARAFGPATRWFAYSCICLLGFVLYLVAFAIFGMNETDQEKVLSFGAFCVVFLFLGSVCAIIGFLRLTNPRP